MTGNKVKNILARLRDAQGAGLSLLDRLTDNQLDKPFNGETVRQIVLDHLNLEKIYLKKLRKNLENFEVTTSKYVNQLIIDIFILRSQVFATLIGAPDEFLETEVLKHKFTIYEMIDDLLHWEYYLDAKLSHHLAVCTSETDNPIQTSATARMGMPLTLVTRDKELLYQKFLEAQYPVVIIANGIGDHILCLPALRALTTAFPKKLTIICEQDAYDILFSPLQFKQICAIQPEDFDDYKIFNAEASAKFIGSCDLLLSLNTWHSISVDKLISYLAPKESVGYYPSFRRVLRLNHHRHAADLAFEVAQIVFPTARFEDFAYPLVLPDKNRLQAKQIRDQISTQLKVMILHADTDPKKMWPTERFAAVLDWFVERYPHFVVFVVGVQELPFDWGRWQGKVIPCYGLPLATSLALVSEADIFLGVDSCMLHAADFFRVPGVALFGPTNPDEWGFRLTPYSRICQGSTMASIKVSDTIEKLNSIMLDIEGR